MDYLPNLCYNNHKFWDAEKFMIPKDSISIPKKREEGKEWLKLISFFLFIMRKDIEIGVLKV